MTDDANVEHKSVSQSILKKSHATADSLSDQISTMVSRPIARVNRRILQTINRKETKARLAIIVVSPLWIDLLCLALLFPEIGVLAQCHGRYEWGSLIAAGARSSIALAAWNREKARLSANPGVAWIQDNDEPERRAISMRFSSCQWTFSGSSKAFRTLASNCFLAASNSPGA